MRILCTVDRHFDTIANRESVTLGRGSLTNTSARAIARHPARSSSGAMSPHPDLSRRSSIPVEQPGPSCPSSNLGQCMRDSVTAGGV